MGLAVHSREVHVHENGVCITGNDVTDWACYLSLQGFHRSSQVGLRVTTGAGCDWPLVTDRVWMPSEACAASQPLVGEPADLLLVIEAVADPLDRGRVADGAAVRRVPQSQDLRLLTARRRRKGASMYLRNNAPRPSEPMMHVVNMATDDQPMGL
jgi:hypothetical protein